MKTKCVIVDDEPLAIRVIEKHIEKMPDVEVIAKCNNAMEALNVLKQKTVDLLFLDIQMPEITGLEFLSALRKPPAVIFTTAYRNYALDAFEYDVIDYLLKPISFDRFIKALNKYYQRIESKAAVIPAQNQMHDSGEFIYIKKNKTLIKIMLRDIRYIESLKDYVRIFTHDKDYFTKQQISKLEDLLPDNEFIRIHKSFIVSIDRLTTISPSSIGIGDKKIPIGRNYKNFVLKKLNYYSNI